MTSSAEQRNIEIVLEAFDSAFNKREKDALDKYWSPHYIQHSAHIGAGREGLRSLIQSMPSTLKYEHGPVTASGDVVMVQGRFSGFKDKAWITVDIVRLADGLLHEHWDVIQDEASLEDSKSGLPMFGSKFP